MYSFPRLFLNPGSRYHSLGDVDIGGLRAGLVRSYEFGGGGCGRFDARAVAYWANRLRFVEPIARSYAQT
jgi:hypothetical protein